MFAVIHPGPLQEWSHWFHFYKAPQNSSGTVWGVIIDTRSIFLDVDVNDDGGDPNLLLLKGTPVIYGKYTEG